VPLTAFQSEVALLLSANRTLDSYLAGGAALHIDPNSKRYSNDLDYFQDSEARVARAFAEDQAALRSAGCSIRVLLQQPGFVSAVVAKAKQTTKVDWAHDTAWRFLPPLRSAIAGYQLHPIDLAINKLLALAGRNEPRDFFDVMDAHRDILPLGALCWAAAGKDPGFTPSLLLDLLRRRGIIRSEDVARLKFREVPDLTQLKREWLAALDAAEEFVTTRPPEELGCLYYSTSERLFVGDAERVSTATPHYGRPGGVLPLLSPSAE